MMVSRIEGGGRGHAPFPIESWKHTFQALPPFRRTNAGVLGVTTVSQQVLRPASCRGVTRWRDGWLSRSFASAGQSVVPRLGLLAARLLFSIPAVPGFCR